jgi:ATP-binding cassette, subfamily B, heavy metal transporter
MKEFIKPFRIYYSLLVAKKFLFVIFISLTIVSSILSFVTPLFFKQFVVNIQDANYSNLYKLLGLLILVRFIELISHSFSFYLGDRLNFSAVIAIRQRIFKHVQDLDFSFHMNKSTGSLISAFKRGDGAIWTLFHEIHHRFLSILVGLVVMIYFLSKIDFNITLVVLISFGIALVITKYLVKINIEARRQHNNEEDNVSAIIVDNMVNFETVKLFSQEQTELKRLKDAFIPWLSSAWKYVNTFRLIDISMGTLINLSLFMIIYMGLSLSKQNLLSLGDFVLILGFIGSFYPQLFELIYGFRDIGKNYADFEKYFKLLDYQIELKDPEKPVYLNEVKGEVEFDKVTFKYGKGRRKAVNNVDLKIRQGQSVAFVGRSGSGKTTLVKLLLRFFDVQNGEIRIDGVSIKKLTKSHLRSFMGVVPQEPILFDNTIAYNIAYGKPEVGKTEIIAAAKIANLHNFIETLQKKYETNVGERGIKLSGGQKQRLAIARMVLSDPDIIIFDEATSQLDSENERLITEALWKVAHDKTTIIIAHRLSTAMRADKIVVMEKGRIVELGSHKQLLAKEGLYKHFWDLQINLN